MAKVEVVVEEVPEASEEAEEKQLQEAAHNLYLASVGAVAMVQDMVSACLVKFVERGEVVEAETRQRLGDRMAKRKHQVRKMTRRQEKTATDADAEMEAQVQGLLDRMNVPSKDDIDALGAQVTELTNKVDELKQA
jgi:poly(hydroxyalkanoate) granule-associated protein